MIFHLWFSLGCRYKVSSLRNAVRLTLARRARHSMIEEECSARSKGKTDNMNMHMKHREKARHTLQPRPAPILLCLVGIRIAEGMCKLAYLFRFVSSCSWVDLQ